MLSKLKNLLVLGFCFFTILPLYLQAGSGTVDLSILLSIPNQVVEAGQAYNNNITISNLNPTSDDLDAYGAQVTYFLPTGATYNSFSGSGWSCVNSSPTVTCYYNSSLTGGNTSNQLSLLINAPNTVTTLTPSASVLLSGASDPDTANNSASDSIDTGKSNLHAVKVASKALLSSDEAFTYTITITNPNYTTTTVPARNVTMVDVIPTGITLNSYNAPSFTCGLVSKTLTCNSLDLAIGGTATITLNVQATPGGTNVVNTANVSSDSSDYNTYPLTPSATVDVQLADIQLTQTLIGGLSSTTAAVGSNVTYRLYVTNLGATPAANVSLVNTIPAGATLVSTSADWNCGTVSPFTCTLNDTSLTNAESYDLDIAVTMRNSVGTVSNNATVSTTSTETITGNNITSLTTTIKGADLNIVKTPNNGTTDIGSNYTYTIKVSNASSLVAAQTVVVTDTLDASMIYVSDTGGCTRSGQVLTCNKASIAQSTNWTFTVTVTMPSNSLADVHNTASVTTTTGQENATNLSKTVRTYIKGPNLNIVKDSNATDGKVGLGKTFYYTIAVNNANTAAAVTANIQDQLPSGVTITNIVSDGWTCPAIPITGTFNCTKANVPGGDTNTLVFTATAPTGSTGNITNTAQVSHSLNSNDGVSSKTIEVTGVILDINKVASATAEAGGLIDYNVTVTNTSHSDAASLTLTDNFASLGTGYTLNSVIDSDGWSCSGSTTLTCTRATLLAEGASSTIHFSVNVPSTTTLGTKTNTASVTTTTTPAPTQSDSASTNILGADLVVTIPTATTAVANEEAIYTATITNNATATAKNVSVTNTFNTAGISGGNFTNISIDCDNNGVFEVTSAPFTCSLGDIAYLSSKDIKIKATAPNYDSNFPTHVNIINNISATTTTTESTTANNNPNWPIEVRGADLVVIKTSNLNEVAVDGLVTYTITVKNQWEANATNIVLTDSVLGSDAFTLIGTPSHDGEWSCPTSSSTGFTCDYNGTLVYNQTSSPITITAKAPNVVAAIDLQKDNEAKVTTTVAERDLVNTNTNLAKVWVRGADLNITKTVSPSTARLQEAVTYSVVVRNNGLATALSAYVDDTLPNGFTNIATSGCNTGSSTVGQSVHCTLGDIAQGATKTFTITANAPKINGSFDNLATTSSSTPEKNVADNQDIATLIVEGADLVMNKIAPARVAGNSQFTYTLNVQNIGLSPAYGATLTDSLPANVNYIEPLNSIDGSWSCSIAGKDISCNTIDSNLTIPTGYNQNIVSFKVSANAAHYWIYNKAVLNTTTSESNLTNNSDIAATEVIDVDLTTRKLINGTNYGATENYIDINGTIVYTLQVANISLVDINITDVNVTDLIPSSPKVSNVSVTPNTRFTCNTPTSPGETLTCTMINGFAAPLQRNENWVTVATIAVNAIDATNLDINNENNNLITNSYKAQTTLSDQNLNNNAPVGGWLYTNTLVRGTNMSIDKTVSSNLVEANQPFSYTLAVKNWPRINTTAQHDLPSTVAQDVVVQDTLPVGVTYVSATGTNWTCNEASGVVTCDYTGTIDPTNTNSNITITAVAPNSNAVTLSNEANVTNSVPELTRLLPDNVDTVDTTTLGANITISKIGPATAGMKDLVPYTITVTNQNSTPASDVYVLDTLPTGADYNGSISNASWTYAGDVNGSKKFIYDQNLTGSTSFTFQSTLPNYTGTVRNSVEAFTSTAETDTQNKADWDTTILGADIVFAETPVQNPNPVGAYGIHQYLITAKNQGLSDAKDINVTLDFNDVGATPGWSDANGTGAGWTCNTFNSINKTLTCNLATLGGSSNSNVLTISSIAPNYNGTIATNSATIIGKDDTNTTSGQTLNLSTTINGSDLRIIKSAKDPDTNSDGLYHDDNITVGVGKPVDFNLSVSNNNLGLAKDIYVTDTFPTGFSDFAITNANDWACSFASNILTCNRAELAANTTAPDILVSATSPASLGNVVNTADVNTTTIESDLSNNSNSVDIKLEGATLNIDLNVTKTQVAMDEAFTYILNITNTGKNNGIDINVTDILDNNFTYIDYAGSDANWTCTNTSNTLTCNQPLIPAYSGNSILKLNVKAPINSIGTFTNSVDINSSSIENSISATAPDVQVVGADLLASISVTPTEALEDRNVTYTINVKDINISTALDVNLTQTFSQAINALYITNDGGGTCINDANTTVRCSFGNLAYNQDKNITVVATMPNTTSIIDPLTSTVTVTTPSTQESLSNDSASADVKVYPIIPVANYQFEECKWPSSPAGSVIDSINGLNGTPTANGPATLNHLLSFDDNNFSTAWRTGSFDGVNDSITIPNDNKLQIINNQTICMWLKPSSFSNRKNPYAKAYGGEGTITQETDGKLNYYYGTSGENSIPYQRFGTSQSIALNQWNHVCIVRDLNKMQLKWYIDGSNTDTVAASYPSAAAGTNPIVIGDGYTNNYKGSIDEVEIYNIALDERAVIDIYNNELAHNNFDGTVRAQISCGVDLSVVKTALPVGDVGAESNLTYNITVTNLSDEPVVDGFSLTDTLPTDTTYLSDAFSSNLSCMGTSDLNCTFSDTLIMRKGESETLTINTKTANKDRANITNIAIATPVQIDENPNNNTGSISNRIMGTDLKITKTATPSFPNPTVPFIYTVKVTNVSSLANARDIVMLDTFDTRLTYTGTIAIGSNEPGSAISCSDTSNTITCNINKLSMGNYAEFNITMQSPNVATNLINEANVTSITAETYPSDNSVSISIDTNTTAAGVNIIDINQKDFRNDASVNRYGNIATIGNTMLVPNPSPLPSGVKLNDVNSSYANSLGGSHINSSSATLQVLPTDSATPDDNITIEYAGIFWGGHIRGQDKNETGENIPFNELTFITPDDAPHTVIADKFDTNITSTATNRVGYYRFKKGDEDNITSNIGAMRIFYGAHADITQTVKDLNTIGKLNGQYSVVDMNITQGTDSSDWAPSGTDWERFRDYGYFGGWSMVVIYSINHRYHREIKFKNLSSFSGFKILTPASPGASVTLPITIDNFITPLSGDIQSSLYTFIQGGDRELSLESLSVTDKNNTKNLVVEDTNNTNNIFNDTISLRNYNGSSITKNPNENYNVGTDIDQFNLNSAYDTAGNCINSDGRPCYLSNQQQQTTVELQVSQANKLDGIEYPSEQAFAQMLSMETQIFAPDFIDSYKECFKLKSPISPDLGWVPCSDPEPALRRGDKVKYRITVLNTGDDYANNVFVSDTLPKEVTYEANSTIVSNRSSFSSLGASAPACSDSDYESDINVRDACVEQLKNYLIDSNQTTPLGTLPDGTDDSLSSIIDTGFSGATYDNGTKTLTVDFGTFNKDNVAWIEFTTNINTLAQLGKTFENSISITFTNPTLESFGFTDSTITQVSVPIESSPVVFNWDNLIVVARDQGRNTVGAKVVNEKFDLNITLGGINSLDADANTSIFINSLNIKDIFNSTNSDIYTSVVDANVGIPLISINNINWLTNDTFYDKASKELGFDMNISIISGDYNDSRMFPYDFNSTALYAGDVFTTRPASFAISLNSAVAGTDVNGTNYQIVNAGANDLNMSINAPDIDGNNAIGYNAVLAQGINIKITTDTSFQIDQNATCFDASLNDFNISNANFIDGLAAVPNAKYNEVGAIKVVLQDINWTARDIAANDCNLTSLGDNNSSDGDGLISCYVDGNSTSVIFRPDHFTYTATTIADGATNFTYMVPNPINDAMFGTLNTKLESKNAEDNTTIFFNNTCFANNVDFALDYNVSSKDIAALVLNTANENNLSNIAVNTSINPPGDQVTTITPDSNFTAGTATINLRLAMDGNRSNAIQPALLEGQNLKGTITSYLGITNANVADGGGTDLNTSNTLHFVYGRVHAPDYRFAGDTGVAKVFYEVYCQDCNSTYRNTMNAGSTESPDSINWYLNNLHSALSDGNVSTYSTVDGVTFGGADTRSSTAITNGAEEISLTAPSLPYKDKVDMNSTSWVTFDPTDFIVEFQDEHKDWAGQGKLGHIIDTNVSKRSNRRLDW